MCGGFKRGCFPPLFKRVVIETEALAVASAFAYQGSVEIQVVVCHSLVFCFLCAHVCVAAERENKTHPFRVYLYANFERICWYLVLFFCFLRAAVVSTSGVPKSYHRQ